MPDTATRAQALLRAITATCCPAMAGLLGVMLLRRRLLDLVEARWRVLVALLPAAVVVSDHARLRPLRARLRRDAAPDRAEIGAAAGVLVSAGYLAAGFLQTAKLIDIPAKVAMLWVFPCPVFRLRDHQGLHPALLVSGLR
jgi:hypothetical protein